MRHPQIILALALGCAAAACVPAGAAAAGSTGATGGTTSGGVTIQRGPENGGARYGSPAPFTAAEPAPAPKPTTKRKAPKKAKKKKRRRNPSAPVLRKFKLGSSSLWSQGRPLDVTFQINAQAREVRVRLIARKPRGEAVSSVDLGSFRTRRQHTVQVTPEMFATLPEGQLELKLSAYDHRSRRLVRQSDVPGWLDIKHFRHRFPLSGKFSFGHTDARFGAPRSGHIHQGQDLTADEGTPVVAPRGGVVTVVAYQAEGAGHYVVVDGAHEDRDYVFMHLQSGSITVEEGQRIPTGKLLGRVGTTGRSSGPHLHFEIWTSGHWYDGGHPIDPRPLLEQWAGQLRSNAVELPSAATAPAPAASAPAAE